MMSTLSSIVASAVNPIPNLEYPSLFLWYENIKAIEAREIRTSEDVVLTRKRVQLMLLFGRFNLYFARGRLHIY